MKICYVFCRGSVTITCIFKVNAQIPLINKSTMDEGINSVIIESFKDLKGHGIGGIGMESHN